MKFTNNDKDNTLMLMIMIIIMSWAHKNTNIFYVCISNCNLNYLIGKQQQKQEKAKLIESSLCVLSSEMKCVKCIVISLVFFLFLNYYYYYYYYNTNLLSLDLRII